MTSIAGRITVRERIDPRITSSLFANYRSSADAVMELIDNALDSRLAERALEIQLTLLPSHAGVGWRPPEHQRLPARPA